MLESWHYLKDSSFRVAKFSLGQKIANELWKVVLGPKTSFFGLLNNYVKF
jgi:hypothetical protein